MDAIVQAILDHASREWSVISDAPIAFTICVSLVGFVGLRVLGWYYQHEISQRDGTIRIHDERHKAKDEFIERLQQSPPRDPNDLEERIEKLATLENEIRLLKRQQQRTLNREQLVAISQILRVAANKQERLSIAVKVPYNDLEAEKYGLDLHSVFHCGISKDSKIGPEVKGLIVRVKNRNSPTVKYLSQALEAAKLPNNIESLDLQFPIECEAELVVGSHE